MRPKVGPSRRSTQAANTRPVATETSLSHGSAWMPRVTPRRTLKETFCWTGRRSGRPRPVIFSRCQFSLNQPRESSWSGSRITSSPGIGVSSTVRSGIAYWPRAAYPASVASLCGRHQASFSRYQSMVRASPSSKSR